MISNLDQECEIAKFDKKYHEIVGSIEFLMLLLKWVYSVVLIQAATQCACLAMLIPTHGRRSDPKSCFHSFLVEICPDCRLRKNVKKEIFYDFIDFIL